MHTSIPTRTILYFLDEYGLRRLDFRHGPSSALFIFCSQRKKVPLYGSLRGEVQTNSKLLYGVVYERKVEK